jgi:hypothetical protein
VIERCYRARLAFETAGKPMVRKFNGDVLIQAGSQAFHTSPMPPLPMDVSIRLGPNCVPAPQDSVKGITIGGRESSRKRSDGMASGGCVARLIADWAESAG